MGLHSITRRLLSMKSAVEGFWKSNGSPRQPTKLGLERLESRLNPAPTANFDAGTAVLTITFDATETVALTLTENGGLLNVNSNKKFVGGNTGTGTNDAKVAAKVLFVDGSTNGANFVDLTAKAGLGGTALRTVRYIGSDGGDFIFLTDNNSKDIYFSVDPREGNNQIKIGAEGVHALTYGNTKTASEDTLTTNAANAKVALSFKGVDADQGGVQVNLNANTGQQVASYKNRTVNVAGAGAKFITGAYGSAGNDVLIGNEEANYLAGFEGNDNIVGGGGNDQLNANRDFAPGYGGTNTGGVVTVDNKSLIDVTKFAGLSASFTSFNQGSVGNKVAAALFSTFGFFNLGEGVAGLDGTVTQAELDADFATANKIADAKVSEDILAGGDGNDGLFGFNNAKVIANGQGGDDVFSSNLLGLASVYNGGDGNDQLIGSVGSTLDGGDGADDLSFVVNDFSALGPLSTAIGGKGNDKISVGFRGVTADAGEGADTVVIGNFADNVLIFNSKTVITGGLGSIPLVQRAQRPG